MGDIDRSLVEKLTRAHAALLDDLRGLEETVDPKSRLDLGQLGTRLAVAQAHVNEHFRFEERNGYMDRVRRREPRLEREIECLAEEHLELEQSLSRLFERAGTANGPMTALRQEVLDWIKRVRQHEARENDLVQGAFNLDIGAED
jgi:hypothetical protein